MRIIKNDLNLKKQAEYLGVSIWQTPSFLFLAMGLVMIGVMTVIFFVSRNQASAEYLVIIETVVVVIILVVGNIMITNMEKLAQINRMKSEFVSIVSHQLKTPLTGIGWNIELVLSNHKDGLSVRQVELLGKIGESNTVMTRMVNDLLDVARIEQGDLSLRREKVNLKDVIEKVIEKNKELTEYSRVKIILGKIREDLEISCDEKKMEVVIDNFISNSIKYNKQEGKVFISVREKKQKAIICIRDEGIGVPDIEKNMIFGKFYRGNQARKIGVGGTGLGLYIAKNIIEQGNGKIWFKSAEDRGSEFCFTIPIKDNNIKE